MNKPENENLLFSIQVRALYKHYFEDEDIITQDLLKAIDFCFWAVKRKGLT